MTDLQSKLNKMNADAEGIQKTQEWPATIRSIEESTAGEVFSGKDGDKPVKNPDREVLVCSVEMDDGETFTQTFSQPTGKRSWQNENFKLGAFRNRYGSVPYEGMKVMVIVDTDGFYRIAL